MLKRNIISNFAKQGTIVALKLVTAPIILYRLGDKGYGLYTLIVALIGYGSILQLGIPTAIVKLLGSQTTNEGRQRIYATVFNVYCVIGAIISWLLYWNAHVLLDLMNAHPISPDLVNAVRLTGVILFLKLFSAFFTAILTTYERIHENNINEAITTIARLLLTIALLSFGFRLTAIMVVFLLAYLVQIGLSVYLVKQYTPIKLTAIQHSSLSQLFELCTLSTKIFLCTVSSELNQNVDKYMIAYFYDVSMVTPYTIAILVANKLWDAAYLISSAYYPRFIAHKNQLKTVFNDYKHGLLLLLGITTMGYLTILLIGKAFIGFWFNAEMAQKTSTILPVLSTMAFITASNYINNDLLIALDRSNVPAASMMTFSIVNIIACSYFIPHYGLMGGVIAFSITYLGYSLVNASVVFRLLTTK